MSLCDNDICLKIKKKGIIELCRIALENHHTNVEVLKQAKHVLKIFSPLVVVHENSGVMMENSTSLPAINLLSVNSKYKTSKKKI